MTNSFALWMLLAVGLLLLVLYVALVNVRRKHLSEIDLSDILPYLLPVDVQAFAEAINGTKKLEWKRLQLAAEYLRRMNHNAALLMRIGYSQRGSTNPMIVEQAKELIYCGVRFRLFVFVRMVALLFWITLFPFRRLRR